MIQLDNHVSIVTGAGSGIGRGTAIELASHGVTVAALDVNNDKINETVAQIRDAGYLFSFGLAAFRCCWRGSGDAQVIGDQFAQAIGYHLGSKNNTRSGVVHATTPMGVGVR